MPRRKKSSSRRRQSKTEVKGEGQAHSTTTPTRSGRVAKTKSCTTVDVAHYSSPSRPHPNERRLRTLQRELEGLRNRKSALQLQVMGKEQELFERKPLVYKFMDELDEHCLEINELSGQKNSIFKELDSTPPHQIGASQLRRINAFLQLHEAKEDNISMGMQILKCRVTRVHEEINDLSISIDNLTSEMNTLSDDIEWLEDCCEKLLPNEQEGSPEIAE